MEEVVMSSPIWGLALGFKNTLFPFQLTG